MNISQRLFGVHLSELMERPNQRPIPIIVKEMIRYLNSEEPIKTDGLFRRAPDSIALIEAKTALNNGGKIDFGLKNDPDLVAGLLKLWLRELPEPLLTFQLYDDFIEAAGFKNPSVMLGKVTETIRHLPEDNRSVIEILFLFLTRVDSQSQYNKMNSANLAMVFGGIILRPAQESVETMMHAPKITAITKFLIDHFDSIFGDSKEGYASMRKKKDSKKIPTIFAASSENERLKILGSAVDGAIAEVHDKLDSVQIGFDRVSSMENAMEIAKLIHSIKGNLDLCLELCKKG